MQESNDVEFVLKYLLIIVPSMATKKKVTKKPVEKKKKVTQEVRKVQRQSNGSTTVALPAEMLRELGWRDKQKVVVKKRGDTIVIADWKPKK